MKTVIAAFFVLAVIAIAQPVSQVELDDCQEVFSPEKFSDRQPTLINISAGNLPTSPKTLVGYLQLKNFERCASRYAGDVIAGFQAKGIKGLILDLRNNAKGYIGEASKTAFRFLREGSIVAVIKDEKGSVVSVYKSDNKSPFFVPLIVMINEGTAGPAEAVAVSLRHHYAATIVGTRSSVKRTPQKYLICGPTKEVIVQIEPDIVIPAIPQTAADIQLLVVVEEFGRALIQIEELMKKGVPHCPLPEKNTDAPSALLLAEGVIYLTRLDRSPVS